jgi:DNA-binding transcriptional MerR regulator
LAPPATIRLSLDTFARRAGLHPDLVRRYVALGLLDPERDANGRLWFTPQALPVVARVQRLHAGLGLNYAAIGLVLDLLNRIDELSALQRAGRLAPPSLTNRPGKG